MSNGYKIVTFSEPGCGKSTFSLFAPAPILVFNYDGAVHSVPPGVSETDVYWQDYPPADIGINPDSNNWRRGTNVGKAIAQDMLDLSKAYFEHRNVTLTNHFTKERREVPFPATLVMDGMVNCREAIEDYVLGNDEEFDPSNYSDPRKFYGKRKGKMMDLMKMVIPLPINIVMNTWHTDETIYGKDKNGKDTQLLTGFKRPDFGGALDETGAGKLDYCLYMYTAMVSNSPRYYVATKPNGTARCIKSRGRYDIPDRIDVTLEKGKPNPWQLVMDGAVFTGKKL